MTKMSPAPRQIPLDLRWPRHDRASREDFVVSESNAQAHAFIDAWEQWKDHRLVLTGPEGSGKTHLSVVWAQETQAEFIDIRSLAEASVRELAELKGVVIEDCDRRLDGRSIDRAFFHLLNVMQEEGKPLLMTGRTSPARWRVQLPDLASRLNATAVASIASPDDTLLKRLLAKLFSDRDILVDERFVNYVASRIDRNFAAAQTVVSALDAESLETASPINIAMARKLFEW